MKLLDLLKKKIQRIPKSKPNKPNTEAQAAHCDCSFFTILESSSPPVLSRLSILHFCVFANTCTLSILTKW
ncbi:unnamed protein product [Lactuca virosa]|uniref:Uncharacterized protein n=1 Tax=Lactuca virosa TaxID=75947 RepID=A0AAU9NJ40_9ASTR|nr:unnamed protein product [Lactuca virosa]